MRKEEFKFDSDCLTILKGNGLSKEKIKSIEKSINKTEDKPLKIRFLDKKKTYTREELIEKKKQFLEKHGKDGIFFMGKD